MSTAVAEPPAETSAEPQQFGSLGDAFNAALSKEKGFSPAEPAPEATPAKETEKAPEKPKAESKPKSALDAALEAPEPEAKADEPVVDEALKLYDQQPNKENWKKSRENFSKLTEEVKQLREQTSKAAAPDPEIKAKISTLEQEREALRKQVAELKDAVTAVNVEYDPEFRAKFVDGKDKLLQKTADSVDKFGGDKAGFLAAMQLSGKERTAALREALSEVDEMDRPRILAKLNDIDKLEEERAEMVKDPQQTYEKLNQKRMLEAQKADEEAAEMRAAAFEKVVRSLPETAKLLKRVDPSVEGAEDWNAKVDAAHATAVRLLQPGATFEETAAIAIKGADYDRVQTLFFDTRKQLQAAQEELARYHSSEPGFRGGGKPKDSSPLSKSPAELYQEALAKGNSGED